MIDHLVYATTDVASSVAELTTLLGVAPTPGGPHIGIGTRNELVNLGGGAYLEIIGPDIDQPDPRAARPFGIDSIEQPGIVAWCARPAAHLDQLRDELDVVGAAYSAPWSMSRRRPDGVVLEWDLMMPPNDALLDGVPFCIDWGAAPHPTESLPPGPVLKRLDLRVTDLEHWCAVLDLVVLDDERVVVSPASMSDDGRTICALVSTEAGDVRL